MRKWFALLATICVISLSACTTNPATPIAATESENPVQESGYPSPVSPEVTAYPLPTTVIESNANSTPDPALGMVNGKLLYLNDPLVNMNLYLGKVLTDDKGLEFVTSLNQMTDPTCVTDSEGNFSFINVPPGRYGLIVDNSSNVFLLLDPADSDKAMLVTIATGDKIELGTLSYTDLPLPPKN